LKKHSKTFSFYQLSAFRYIKTYSPERFSQLRIKDNLSFYIKEIEDLDVESFENFKGKEKQRLDALIMNFIDKKLFSDFDKSILTTSINCLELCFFNYLLDSYEDKNAQNLIKHQFAEIDNFYIEIIINGITTISKSHGDELWYYEAFCLRDKFLYARENKELVESSIKNLKKLNSILNKLSKQALCSDIYDLKKAEIELGDLVRSLGRVINENKELGKKTNEEEKKPKENKKQKLNKFKILLNEFSRYAISLYQEIPDSFITDNELKTLIISLEQFYERNNKHKKKTTISKIKECKNKKENAQKLKNLRLLLNEFSKYAISLYQEIPDSLITDDEIKNIIKNLEVFAEKSNKKKKKNQTQNNKLQKNEPKSDDEEIIKTREDEKTGKA
jgi:hypothetical protein